MQGAVDDRRHSMLSRARPISQTAIDAFAHARSAAPLLGPDSYGRVGVLEVEAKSALTLCRMPGEPWSLNPYTGCSHDCAYCYVPDVAHVERPRWGSYVVVKRNLPAVLAHEVRRKEPRPVLLSSATDPYQPAEADHLVTRRSLEVLARADWPVHVLTRSPLVKRDLGLFRRFTDLGVTLSVPTIDDDARRLVEPSAPPIEGRLRTLRRLADEGFAPAANLMPTYPPTNGLTADDVAATFADAGVASVAGGAWRYLPSFEAEMRRRLGDDEAAEQFLARIRDEAAQLRWFRALEGAFARRKVPFHAWYKRNYDGR